MSSLVGDPYQHAALLYGSSEELLSAAVPFLDEGLAAGEAALLACSEDHNQLLADALPPNRRLIPIQRHDIYTRPEHAVSSYRRLVKRQTEVGIARVRLVGEVSYGPDSEHWEQWTRVEAIVNVALATLPLWSVCAYNTRAVPHVIQDGTMQAHPLLLTTDGTVANDRYLQPAMILRRAGDNGPRPIEATPPTLHLHDLTNPNALPRLRQQLRAAVRTVGRHEQREVDFVAAMCEMISNGFRHGRAPLDVRLWNTPSLLLGTVTDHGDGFDDPLAGYLPPDTADVGAGLWLARHSCDTLEPFRSPDGFTVRIATRLPEGVAQTSPSARLTHAELAATRAIRARTRAERLLRRLDNRVILTETIDRAGQEAAARLGNLRAKFDDHYR